MKIKLDKLQKKDRGIVREIRIPKLRDEVLEKEFLSLVVKEKELDRLDHTLKAEEEAKRENLNKVILKGQQIEDLQEKNKNAKAEITRLADEQAKIVEETNNQIKEENAKDDKTRRKQRVLDSQQIVIRANNKLKVFDEKNAERDVHEEELKLTHKELDGLYKNAQANHDLAVKALKDNDKALSEIRNDIKRAMKKGQKVADDGFEEAKKEIEEVRVKLKYKSIRPIGQNEKEYIFLLLEPEEYKGSLDIKIEEVQ